MSIEELDIEFLVYMKELKQRIENKESKTINKKEKTRNIRWRF